MVAVCMQHEPKHAKIFPLKRDDSPTKALMRQKSNVLYSLGIQVVKSREMIFEVDIRAAKASSISEHATALGPAVASGAPHSHNSALVTESEELS